MAYARNSSLAFSESWAASLLDEVDAVLLTEMRLLCELDGVRARVGIATIDSGVFSGIWPNWRGVENVCLPNGVEPYGRALPKSYAGERKNFVLEDFELDSVHGKEGPVRAGELAPELGADDVFS
jgi:hypothetical protein